MMIFSEATATATKNSDQIVGRVVGDAALATLLVPGLRQARHPAHPHGSIRVRTAAGPARPAPALKSSRLPAQQSHPATIQRGHVAHVTARQGTKAPVVMRLHQHIPAFPLRG